MKPIVAALGILLAISGQAWAVTCPSGSAFELRRPSDNIPLACVTGSGGDGRFSVSSVTINGVSYNFPGTQGAASTILQNNGSGTLSWVAGGGSGDAVLASTQTFSGENTFTSTTTHANTRKICPSGFFEVHRLGRALGCMQTAEQGTGGFQTAVETCWTTYGARLPTTNEWSIACTYGSMTDATDDYERTSDTTDGQQSHIVGSGGCYAGSISNFGTTSTAYRCWIPK